MDYLKTYLPLIDRVPNLEKTKYQPAKNVDYAGTTTDLSVSHSKTLLDRIPLHRSKPLISDSALKERAKNRLKAMRSGFPLVERYTEPTTENQSFILPSLERKSYI